MTRGNQRDLARAKNQKKQAEMGKKNNDKGANAGLTLEQRKQRDADRMREKQMKDQAANKAETAAAAPKK